MSASAMERMLETVATSIMSRIAPGVTMDDLKAKASGFLQEWEALKATVETELKNEYDNRLTEVEAFVTKMKEAFPEHFEEHEPHPAVTDATASTVSGATVLTSMAETAQTTTETHTE